MQHKYKVLKIVGIGNNLTQGIGVYFFDGKNVDNRNLWNEDLFSKSDTDNESYHDKNPEYSCAIKYNPNQKGDYILIKTGSIKGIFKKIGTENITLVLGN